MLIYTSTLTENKNFCVVIEGNNLSLNFSTITCDTLHNTSWVEIIIAVVAWWVCRTHSCVSFLYILPTKTQYLGFDAAVLLQQLQKHKIPHMKQK